MGKTEGGILEKEEGEVRQALGIVDAAFEQSGVGIEDVLTGKGWNVSRSMICTDEGDGRGDWRVHHSEDDVNKIE